MKNAIIGLVGFVVISSGLNYLVSAVVTKQQVDTINNRAKTNTGAPVITRDEAYKSIMAGCDTGTIDRAGFDQTAYCACTANGVLNRYGVNKVASDGLNMSEAEMIEKYQPIIDSCLMQQEVEGV